MMPIHPDDITKIVDDVLNSYRLALKSAGVLPSILDEADLTTNDYIDNHYDENWKWDR